LIKTSAVASIAAAVLPRSQFAADAARHNVILFIADGLRSQIGRWGHPRQRWQVCAMRASTPQQPFGLSHIHDGECSAFANRHALGYRRFSNTKLYGVSIQGTVTPTLETTLSCAISAGGLAATTSMRWSIIAEARRQEAAKGGGLSAAVIGKLVPQRYSIWARSRAPMFLLVDDSTGAAGQGVPIAKEWSDAMTKGGRQTNHNSRGENANAGTNSRPGLVGHSRSSSIFSSWRRRSCCRQFQGKKPAILRVYCPRSGRPLNMAKATASGRSCRASTARHRMSAIRASGAALAALEQSLKALQLF